ncbi:GntR family transcriptional regulator [Brevibacillus ruminantium]|uniref:GntR family transcriptional regulator n=1 Tax=Brevibacillus ruminantium TaxID=2950604 RepID=A0ABY4WA49_9BACL|nr:GntR family transcriptional regulator [Brevibacillus ruminantium]USG64071.1 GntR family transcriptional regulator [Brevibacillus ruminantium]
MWPRIDPRSDLPIYQQIIQQIKEAVAKGLIAPGEKLPSVRELAGRIAINPNTIAKAYQELEREGIIETIRGRGTFAAALSSGVGDEMKQRSIEGLMEKILVEAHYLQLGEEELLAMLHSMAREWYEKKGESP